MKLDPRLPAGRWTAHPRLEPAEAVYDKPGSWLPNLEARSRPTPSGLASVCPSSDPKSQRAPFPPRPLSYQGDAALAASGRAAITGPA